ncbi:MAG: RNA polymerase sigma factor [Planctomycetota bacterium]
MHLLERVADGDARAVRDVIDRYGDLVWSLARRFTNSDADAEEAAQDIFVMLWRKASKYDREAGAEITFVSLLARRELIDRWRRASRRPKLTDVEELGDPVGADAHDELDELASKAMRAFGGLEKDVQMALRLSVEHGCSHGQIADLTGAPLGTVKSRVRKGLKLIREAVEGSSLTGATP